MPTLSAFLNVSLDGYYVDAAGDMSWAHKSTGDAEWQAFVEGNAQGDNALVFGRVTYNMMASYWPSPMAASQNPVVAARINATPKIVCSRTLRDATWNNTSIVSDDMLTSMRARKAGAGPNMTILGSGRTPFESANTRLPLTLKRSRTFGNGNLLLHYTPFTSR